MELETYENEFYNYAYDNNTLVNRAYVAAIVLEGNDTARSGRAFALEYAFNDCVTVGDVHCMDVARIAVYHTDHADDTLAGVEGRVQ